MEKTNAKIFLWSFWTGLIVKRFKTSYLVLIFLVIGCQNTSIDGPTDEVLWKRLSLFDNGTGQMNSNRIDDQLNILGASGFLRDVDISGGSFEPFRLGLYSGSGRLKFPMAQNYYVITDQQKVIIRSAFSTEDNSKEIIVDLKSFDPDFHELFDIPYWQGECLGLSNENVLLVPYKALKNGISIPTPYFALIKINPGQSDNQLEIESTKLIRQDIFAGEAVVRRIETHFNQFFVVMGFGTYRVSPDGLIDIVADKPLVFLEKNNNLLAFGSDYSTDQVFYFKSEDFGITWNSLGTINLPLLAGLNYTEIDNRIVGFIKGQIFELEVSDENYSIKELESEGLSLADISSITKANEGKVLITSRCNAFTDTCGVFIKSIDNFFDRKKEN